MLRKLSIWTVSVLLFSIIAGCSSSHTQEEYDALQAENETLQEQYDELLAAYDPLNESNTALKDEIAQLQELLPDDQVFNTDVYDALTSEAYDEADLQDQRLWGTYSVDDGDEKYVLYSSGLYVNLYLTSDSSGEYFITYGSYSYDQSRNQLSITDHSSDTAAVYGVTFNDDGLKLEALNSDNQNATVWTSVK